jgi:hypothetical protein
MTDPLAFAQVSQRAHRNFQVGCRLDQGQRAVRKRYIVHSKLRTDDLRCETPSDAKKLRKTAIGEASRYVKWRSAPNSLPTLSAKASLLCSVCPSMNLIGIFEPSLKVELPRKS